MTFIQQHWKVIAAFVGAVAVVVSSAWTDHTITTAEWVQIATAFFGAVLVYIVPNIPQWPAVKTVVVTLLAACGLLTSYLAVDNHLSNTQWMNLGLVLLSAVGVHLLNNTGDALDQLSAGA